MYKLKLNVLRWRYKLHLMNWKERAMYEAYMNDIIATNEIEDYLFNEYMGGF